MDYDGQLSEVCLKETHVWNKAPCLYFSVPVLSWWQVANEWQQGGFECAP